MTPKELIAELRSNVNKLESIQRELKELQAPSQTVPPDIASFLAGAVAALKVAKQITDLPDDEIDTPEKTLRERNQQLANVIHTGEDLRFYHVLAAPGSAPPRPTPRARAAQNVPPKLDEARPPEPADGDPVQELQDLLDQLNEELKELCELEEPEEQIATEIAAVRDALTKFFPSARRAIAQYPQVGDEQRAEMGLRLGQGARDADSYLERIRNIRNRYRPARPWVPVDVPAPPPPPPPRPASPVVMRRAESVPTGDQPLWSVIRNRTLAIGFNPYKAFIDQVMCYDGFPQEKQDLRQQREFELRLPYMRADSYTRLKVATELFLMQECGILVQERQRWDFKEPQDPADPHYPFQNRPDVALAPEGDRKRLLDQQEEAHRLGREDVPTGKQLEDDLKAKYLARLGNEYTLPYFAIIRDKLKELPLKGKGVAPPNCYGILKDKLTGPCLLELIWSFWHEAGFMVRTMHVVNRRFQNIRGGDRDPLTRFDLDSLRPLGNLLWGHLADEQHRLTIQRRVYEYDHHYGLRLQQRADAIHPADSRSKFIGAFHNLLYLTSVFYKEDDDTTVIADAFRVLNALREVHLLLAEGAHNQFGDLPWTARAEMLMEQWLLGRPEMREFLGGKIAVPYPESWMDRVDVMKQLQGWNDVSITHFHDLAVHGEQILLSIRYGNWSVVNFGPQAANWARYWRPEIQRYIHAYQAVTGVDLAIEPVDTTSPAELLRQRALAPR